MTPHTHTHTRILIHALSYIQTHTRTLFNLDTDENSLSLRRSLIQPLLFLLHLNERIALPKWLKFETIFRSQIFLCALQTL
jgi:hypothetical protein